MRWRWDQGRLHYFRYENILNVAKVLESLEGVSLGNGPDLLRAPLTSATELPFLPVHYKVWRNYARVFECALLATRVNGRLVTTDLCRKMATKPALFPPDEYLNFVFSHFALPFPAFDDYNPNVPPVFPFVAMLKFAIARGLTGFSLAEAFSYIIGNACSMNTKVRYPWTDNILELHHVLPLAASLNANGTTTLLDDLVALCPSCHKSIHVFYRIKLREWGIEDFGSKKMALDVYEMAKREIGV